MFFVLAFMPPAHAQVRDSSLSTLLHPVVAENSVRMFSMDFQSPGFATLRFRLLNTPIDVLLASPDYKQVFGGLNYIKGNIITQELHVIEAWSSAPTFAWARRLPRTFRRSS